MSVEKDSGRVCRALAWVALCELGVGGPLPATWLALCELGVAVGPLPATWLALWVVGVVAPDRVEDVTPGVRLLATLLVWVADDSLDDEVLGLIVLLEAEGLFIGLDVGPFLLLVIGLVTLLSLAVTWLALLDIAWLGVTDDIEALFAALGDSLLFDASAEC